MRVKPKPKTCYSRRCVIYDIATGTRSETHSITKAAAKIGCSTSFLGQIIMAGMNTNGFVVTYIEDEQKAIVKLRALQAKGDYKPRKQRKREEKLVPLRIDARTVIYVTPDKATPEYAEQWRQRHDADSRHTESHEFINSNNTLNTPKKRGGRQ